MNTNKNNQRSDKFLSKIKDMIIDIIEKELYNTPKIWVGTVTAVSGASLPQTADVLLGEDSTTTVLGLKNKSNEILSISDEVYIESPRGRSLTNAYISIKK
jgi:hypothetical protein